ncbi:pre-mRNA-splicing ATP-dependent RNA helicase prp28 [Aulographum hederae CBS 113979]|uniref:RNA helicase n=1 Tax=Aulographum hederae CBS 113979 TaxID=1176131 RepID=A0A6G1GUG0_9PEZI|nr:pre-mRNA-splicing ATP-dependent RNA helicase prp28 [Aulographum hederae CBS 113979]
MGSLSLPEEAPPSKKSRTEDPFAMPPKAPKRVPMTIEDLIKKNQAGAEASKPKYLNKAAREKLRLEREAQEAEEQKRKDEATAASRAALMGTTGLPSRPAGDRGGRGSRPSIPTGPRAMRPGEVPTGPASMRPQEKYDMGPPPPPSAKRPAAKEDKKMTPEEKALVLHRQRYMGVETNTSTFSAKKKRRRTTEKKFNFEWNPEDDTSVDYNPLYNERVEATFFGRGQLGGIAEDENQIKRYAKLIEETDREHGQERAQQMLEMHRRRKEEEARSGLELHWSKKELRHMRERDWRIMKEDFNISTKGGGIPNPMRNWNESGLPTSILRIVDAVGYDEPSAVQRAAIPIALQSRDLIGVAVTGSGKTAAFLLPLLVYISALPPLDDATRNDGPYAIILAPTRELAQQIELEAKKFAGPLGFNCVSLVGGHKIETQAYSMRDGAEIVIATPGRLLDCIERRMLVLGQCCYVIMDEADRMIDMGFEEPVNKILDALPVGNQKPDSEDAENAAAMNNFLSNGERYRQTMMYTATMPAAVERIAQKYLRRPAIVNIGSAGEAVDTVEQRVEFIAGEDKRKKRMIEILQHGGFYPPIIVFVNIKRNCDAIARDIQRAGFSVATLHGSKTQEQREAALASLKNGNSQILVATDLAGRGLDVTDVSLVINFNMPPSIEAYTHRIGRTGRAGKSGVAITFLGGEDNDLLYDLKNMLSKSNISRVPEELRKHEAAQQKTQKHQKRNADDAGFGGKGSTAGWK